MTSQSQAAPKTTPPTATSEIMVTAALNEHGFLLQQVVLEKLRGEIGQSTDRQDQWHFEASEYPVTAADGSQTKIDLVLKHAKAKGTYICVECKRANPRFKKWVFFGTETGVAGMPGWVGNVETVFVGHRRDHEPPHNRHELARIMKKQDIPFFSYYVEAKQNRTNQSGAQGNAGQPQASSSTDTIEKGFQQLLRGHSGLVLKFCESNDTGSFKSIPVLVTTAEIVEARFDARRISEVNGMIDPADLTLSPMDYCAVNYRADDSLSVKSRTAFERSIGTSDLVNSQIRTVFIVNIAALNKFLNWAGRNLINLA